MATNQGASPMPRNHCVFAAKWPYKREILAFSKRERTIRHAPCLTLSPQNRMLKASSDRDTTVESIWTEPLRPEQALNFPPIPAEAACSGQGEKSCQTDWLANHGRAIS